MHETAYAKINLALHVRGREPDGYHRIETVFAFCEDGDLLGVAPSRRIELEVAGAFADALAPGGHNLVLEAAQALAKRHDVRSGAALRLDKRLPVAAGIGGGSADAAAALRLLARWWDLPADEGELLEIAAGLGADVPACLASRPVRGEGRGDRLRPLDPGMLSGTPVLLVNPGLPLATASVFGAWDGFDRGPLDDWREGRNDLEAAARGQVPEIGAVLDALGGAWFARMSGSGATCFGLYGSDTDRDAAAASIAAARPRWWTLPTRLR